MVNRLQFFNRDILLSLEVSQELRTSMVLDVLDLSINSPQLIYDEEVNKRLSLMKQFLNQEYRNFLFLLEKVKDLEKCSLELIDLYDIFDLMIDNQELESYCSKNLSEYIMLRDHNLNQGMGLTILIDKLSSNDTEYYSVSNEITINNKNIEKIKRKEM